MSSSESDSQDNKKRRVQIEQETANSESISFLRNKKACDTCKRKKIRCNGLNIPGNRCSTCIAQNLECTFADPGKKRGHAEPSFNALGMRLEKLEKVLEHIVPNADLSPKDKAGSSKTMSVENRLKRIETVLTRMSPNSKLIEESELGTSLSASQAPSNSTIPASLSSPGSQTSLPVDPSSSTLPPRGFFLDFDSAEAALAKKNDALLEFVAGRDHLSLSAMYDDDDFESMMDDFKRLKIHPVEHRFYGKSSEAQLIRDAVELRQEYTGQDTDISGVVSGRRRPQFWTEYTNPTQYAETSKPNLQKWSFISKWENNIIAPYHPNYVYPPPDLLYSLIDLYFAHFNLYLPLLHRPTFQRAVNEGLHLRPQKDGEDEGPMFGATLLLVCAIGSRYSNDERVLISSPGSGSNDGSRNGKDRHTSGWKYFSQVQEMRKSVLTKPTLYTLQLYALTAEFLQCSSTPHLGWSRVGIGIRMAQDIGAHRRKKGITAEDELLKRAFWVLLSLDRMLSSGLGRPCAIQDDQYDLEFPLEVDDEYWEDPDPEKRFRQPPDKPSKITAFNLTLRLHRITGVILRTIYTINKGRFGFIAWPRWEEHIVVELDSALNKWNDAVPEYLRWDPNREDLVFFNQSVMMYSHYHIVKILIHQAYLRSQYLGKTSSSSSSTSLPFPSFTLCLMAARSSHRVVQAHRKRNGDIGLLPSTVMGQFLVGIILLLNIWKKGSTASISVTTAANGDNSRDRDLEDVHECIDLLGAYDERFSSSGRIHLSLQQLMLDSHPKVPSSSNDTESPLSAPFNDPNVSTDPSLFDSMPTMSHSFMENFADIFGPDFLMDLDFGASSTDPSFTEQVSGTVPYSHNHNPVYYPANVQQQHQQPVTVSPQSLSLPPGVQPYQPLPFGSGNGPGGSAPYSLPQSLMGYPPQSLDNQPQGLFGYSDYENFYGAAYPGTTSVPYGVSGEAVAESGNARNPIEPRSSTDYSLEGFLDL